MSIGIQAEGLTTSIGSQRIWENVGIDLPASEGSVFIGPSGTATAVHRRSLIGLLRPERGQLIVERNRSIKSLSLLEPADDLS